MAPKKKPETEIVTRAGGYGLTADGRWVLLGEDGEPAPEVQP